MDGTLPLRIGCASAFWGDTNTAAQQLVASGAIDVLVFDYLAEVTLSIMAGQRLKDPTLGYAKDFVRTTLPPLLSDIAEQRIKVVSNAGGLNPHACASALQQEIRRQGLSLTVAIVEGDNIMPKWNALEKESTALPGEENIEAPPVFITNNVYLGAQPITAALNAGADIVITGRIVDSALALGPLLHHFNWAMDDYDKLAQGSLAGHVIECGTQCTGGNFTDWHRINAWENLGFPIVTCQADGTFTVSKPMHTDGLVDAHTVAEQITYEIENPSCYSLPDVTCDFSQVQVTNSATEHNQVLVQGARGFPPSSWLKYSATYMDGFRCTAYCVLAGPEAVTKARITVDNLILKINRDLSDQGKKPINDIDIELLGSEAQYGARANRLDTREVVIKLACHHTDKKALIYFSQEIAQASTGMTPGFTTLLGGRPTVYPVARLHSGLVPRKHVESSFTLSDNMETLPFSTIPKSTNTATNSKPLAELSFADWIAAGQQAPPSNTNTVPLGLLALTRSGDKGDHANIGIIARKTEYLPAIVAALTPTAVAHYFAHLFDPALGKVAIYNWPGLNALNIVLKHCLGKGGIASLRSDPQGKALGQQLLDFPIPVTEILEKHLPADRSPPYVQQ